MPGDISQDQEVGAARDEPNQFLGPLLQHHRSALRRVARRRMTARLRTRMDTSDIVQQTMVEAWQSWPGFLGNSRGQLVNWLQTLLRRVVYRESRRQEIHQAPWRFDSSAERSLHDRTARQIIDRRVTSPAEDIELREQSSLLQCALAKLPELQRQVIVLRHFHGLQFAEIASLTSRSTAAARMVYIRGIITLRQRLDRTSHEHRK